MRIHVSGIFFALSFCGLSTLADVTPAIVAKLNCKIGSIAHAKIMINQHAKMNIEFAELKDKQVISKFVSIYEPINSHKSSDDVTNATVEDVKSLLSGYRDIKAMTPVGGHMYSEAAWETYDGYDGTIQDGVLVLSLQPYLPNSPRAEVTYNNKVYFFNNCHLE